MRVLFTCLPGFGHFHPMVPLAQAVRRRGHEVAFASAGDFCPVIERAGFPAFAAGLSLPEQLEQARRRFPGEAALDGQERFTQFVPRMLAAVAAPARVPELVPIVERWRPDVLVRDETDFAGPVAATVVGIPYADQSVLILRPLEMARLAGETLSPMCQEWGVELGPFGGMFRYLYLDVCPPSLQSPEIALVDVAYLVHNIDVAEPDDAVLPPWVQSLPEAPTVYVSLGTVFNQNRKVFEAVLEGLQDEPFNLILTTGPDSDPAVFGPRPANVHIERYIPQSLLLGHCDVAVNQGGTAILPILARGLPILVLPQGANQFHNAAACVAAGAARQLLPSEV
ncbi:MAG TPA: glycosyltransferase, partial [Acidimicrobiales bacterium]|nr:glycosyltransferase [Acidimicrobiales bacterium]